MNDHRPAFVAIESAAPSADTYADTSHSAAKAKFVGADYISMSKINTKNLLFI
jgi:hypothetical protein